jgi:(2Fe-2S) ferredoxin
MPDTDSLFERLSPEQVDAILDAQLSGDSSAESRSSETAKYGPSNETSEVDRAFDELMSG